MKAVHPILTMRRLERFAAYLSVLAVVVAGLVTVLVIALAPAAPHAFTAIPNSESRAAHTASTMPAAVGPITIQRHYIDFTRKRLQQTTAYMVRHYGLHTNRLVKPQVIVEHFTEGPSYISAWNTFDSDAPDQELRETPGTCAHFIIDQAGVIHQAAPLGTVCRHTVGLNYTAIGIENVGYSDGQILSDHAQFGSMLRLTTWLRCTYGISVQNVIGHNESLTSPYHHELVARLHMQTHQDWRKADMSRVRAMLRTASCADISAPKIVQSPT